MASEIKKTFFEENDNIVRNEIDVTVQTVHIRSTFRHHNYLTLIRESWKKIQNAGLSPSAFRGKNPERSVASFVYVPVLWIFFPENALGDGPKKWHIFLFSTASFHTYWHMPFEIGIIR